MLIKRFFIVGVPTTGKMLISCEKDVLEYAAIFSCWESLPSRSNTGQS